MQEKKSKQNNIDKNRRPIQGDRRVSAVNDEIDRGQKRNFYRLYTHIRTLTHTRKK